MHSGRKTLRWQGAQALSTPQLNFSRGGANAVLTWPVSTAVFTLESTTNVAPGGPWVEVSPPPDARQRPGHGHESHFGRTAVLSFESVIGGDWQPDANEGRI